jgi:glycosyltransferase involved in cell wall biosynthesis
VKKTQNPLFSIILLYYNQKPFIKNAIDSILKQDYDNIELIICDDGSDLNEKELKSYINKNIHKNIKKLVLIFNKKNIGTVKTTNNAIKESTGDYILIFAADDELYNDLVITNFVKSFNKTKSKIISSQCLLYDKQLKKSFGNYVDSKTAVEVNNLDSLNQFKKLSFSCLYAAGATAYKNEIFNQAGLISEKYEIVEDLSYWLKVTREGNKIVFFDFIGLKHRDGGISKSDDSKIVTQSQKKYYNDILKIKETEILPYLKIFTRQEQIKLLNDYRNYLFFLTTRFPSQKKYYKKKNFEIILKKPFYLFYIIKNKLKSKMKLKSTILSIMKIIFWILLNLTILLTNIINPLVISIYFIISYLFSDFLIKIIIKIWRKL